MSALANTYAVAIHEAGHAVALHRLDQLFDFVTIKPGLWFKGCVRHHPDCEENYLSDAEIENRAALAGIDADFVENMEDMADEDVDEETREWRAARREFMRQLETMIEHDNIISLAGPLAESWHVRKPLFAILEGGGASDYRNIRTQGGLTNAMITATTDLLEKEWRTVLLIASALMERSTLTYREFLEVLADEEVRQLLGLAA